jgi:hypothetical protein
MPRTPDDPALGEVHSAITRVWATYRNRFGNDPRQVQRVVLANALAAVGNVDSRTAAIFVLIGHNLYSRLPVSNEAPIWEELLRFRPRNLTRNDLPERPSERRTVAQIRNSGSRVGTHPRLWHRISPANSLFSVMKRVAFGEPNFKRVNSGNPWLTGLRR